MQRQRLIIAAGAVIFPHGPNIVAATDYSSKLVLTCTNSRARHQRPSVSVPMQCHCMSGVSPHSPNVVTAAAYCVKLVLASAKVRAWLLRPRAPIPVKGQRPINVAKDVIYPHSPHVVAAAAYALKLIHT